LSAFCCFFHERFCRHISSLAINILVSAVYSYLQYISPGVCRKAHEKEILTADTENTEEKRKRGESHGEDVHTAGTENTEEKRKTRESYEKEVPHSGAEDGVMIKTSGYWYTNRCSKEQLPVVVSVGAAYDPVRTLNSR
jgi:hypothetical protein